VFGLGGTLWEVLSKRLLFLWEALAFGGYEERFLCGEVFSPRGGILLDPKKARLGPFYFFPGGFWEG